jgi:hypothetical protein
VTGLSVVRRFQPGTAGELGAQLEQAADELSQATVGSEFTWLVPAGDYDFAEGWELGAEDVSLHLRGPQDGAQSARWRFGHGAPVDGDLTALRLIGRRVSVDGLALEARCSGFLSALQLAASVEATADDVRLGELRGTGLVGLQAQAPRVGLTDVSVAQGRATENDASGIVAIADELLLQRLAVDRMSASETAIGIHGRAVGRTNASSLQVSDLRGAQALGMSMVLRGAETRLQLLDLRARQVEAQAGRALGVLALGAGAAELRGVSATQMLGDSALGVLVGVAGELQWLAGEIVDVRGRTQGAAGVRVLAAESEQGLAIADLHIEAVRGLPTGTQARPAAAWGDWWRSGLGAAGRFPEELPAVGDLPEPDVAGLHVDAHVEETAHWTDTDPGLLSIRDCVLRRISGTALQAGGGLRDLELRRIEAWTALRAGWLDGERLLLAQLTWHRHQHGLQLGPAAVTAVNCLVTGIAEGLGIVADPDADFDDVRASFLDRPPAEFDLAPEPLPYLDPGPAQVPASMSSGALAPVAGVDLRLRPQHALDAEAVPGDAADEPRYVGAHEPDAPARCELRDPQPPSVPAPPALERPSPVVDYRARDARSLLAVMMDRARAAIPQWQERNAADQLTMFMELLAHELDHLSYRQEVAASEGYFATALSRRSLEDHARLVDYQPDPGLSATTMVRFDINAAGSRALSLDPAATFEIPADTLVVNPDATEMSLVFATEDALRYDPALRDLRLSQPLETGAVSAILAGDLIEHGHGAQPDRSRIEPGRWLVLVPGRSGAPRHVVRVVRVELGADSTQVFWDPRRPSLTEYPVEGTRVYGNVVPAHHGVPLAPVSEHLLPGALYEAVESMRPWREQMTLPVDNDDGTVREVELPLDPVSVQARGWPRPDQRRRAGLPMLQVWVDDERWTRVEQLALCGSEDDAYVLRPGRGGGGAIRFGDGVNGAALPRGQVAITLRMRVGLGRHGNVGVGALTRLLGFGAGGDIASLAPRAADRDRLIRRYLSVDNVVPGRGGRDPEPIERIRYRAPRQVRESLSAVALSDFARLLEQMPEVAAARSVLVDAGIRRGVRVTVLLADEDTLAGAEPGSQREAERLRRWAAVRHRLEAIRLLGFDVEVLPPVFVPLDLDIAVDAEPWASAERVRLAVLETLSGDSGLFDPDRRGLGRDVQVDRLHQELSAVGGVAAARVLRLRRLRPDAVEHASLGRLPVGPDEVAVVRHPYGGDGNGVVTVQVCGGLA